MWTSDPQRTANQARTAASAIQSEDHQADVEQEVETHVRADVGHVGGGRCRQEHAGEEEPDPGAEAGERRLQRQRNEE